MDESLVEYLNLRQSGFSLSLALYNTILDKCEDRPLAATFVLNDMQRRKLLPDEVSYLPLLRGAAKRGDFTSGLNLLDEMTRGGLLLRRRSFAPLLKAASSAGNTEVVIKTWLRLRRDQIQPKAEDCLDLLCALLKNNTAMGAPQWMAVHQIFMHALTEVAPVTHDVALRILDLFQPQVDTAGSKFRSFWGRTFTALSWPSFLPGAYCPHVSASVALVEPSEKAHCPRCSTQLRLLGLTPKEKKEMRSKLLTAHPNHHHDLWNLASFLRKRHGKPFTVCIDGANVAYFGQNHSEGSFSFHQIDLMLEHLRQSGASPDRKSVLAMPEGMPLVFAFLWLQERTP